MTDIKNSGCDEDAQTPEMSFRPIEVVLVDDSKLMRDRVVASLAVVNGVGVIREAGDVPSGLRLLEVAEPDVLILDIEMPGQSGIDLLKIAKRRTYAAVIIMLSIHDHPILRQKCLDLGADFYFHKLNEFERVAAVCRELVERRRQSTGE
jgi:DNA-binding NarL/FixJ family response regulator